MRRLSKTIDGRESHPRLIQRLYRDVSRSAIVAAVLLGIVGGCRGRDLRTAKPDYYVNATDIAGEFTSDPEASERKYFDKVVQLRGRVANVTDQGYTVNLLGGSTIRFVTCHFASHAETGTIRAGDTITIRGNCGMCLESGGNYFLTVFNCILVG
jgi:hypothetical protein